MKHEASNKDPRQNPNQGQSQGQGQGQGQRNPSHGRPNDPNKQKTAHGSATSGNTAKQSYAGQNTKQYGQNMNPNQNKDWANK